MSEYSTIEWTDHTFNPWWGCTNVSPACDHCYAETFAKRTGHAVWGHEAPRRFFGDAHWDEPRRWNARAARDGVRRKVFCASMADVFEDRRDLDDSRARLWSLIDATPWLDWLLLTKRPGNIARMVPSAWLASAQPNIWYGTTVESDDYLWRVYQLEMVRAVVRFISYEPALGRLSVPIGRGISWVIAGAESGGGARPMDEDWIRAVRDQCQAAGIAFFYKQKLVNGRKVGLPLLDGRSWAEFPTVSA